MFTQLKTIEFVGAKQQKPSSSILKNTERQRFDNESKYSKKGSKSGF